MRPKWSRSGKTSSWCGRLAPPDFDEVDARQGVLQGDLLGAEVLLHRHRVVGAALHRRVVGDDHALGAGDPADAGDDAGARHLAAVHAVRGELRELKERRADVEQPADCDRARAAGRAQMVLGPRPLAAALA